MLDVINLNFQVNIQKLELGVIIEMTAYIDISYFYSGTRGQEALPACTRWKIDTLFRFQPGRIF